MHNQKEQKKKRNKKRQKKNEAQRCHRAQLRPDPHILRRHCHCRFQAVGPLAGGQEWDILNEGDSGLGVHMYMYVSGKVLVC